MAAIPQRRCELCCACALLISRGGVFTQDGAKTPGASAGRSAVSLGVDRVNALVRGVDGCPGGWLAVWTHDATNVVEAAVFSTGHDLLIQPGFAVTAIFTSASASGFVTPSGFGGTTPRCAKRPASEIPMMRRR